jgi:hypothetical protein
VLADYPVLLAQVPATDGSVDALPLGYPRSPCARAGACCGRGRSSGAHHVTTTRKGPTMNELGHAGGKLKYDEATGTCIGGGGGIDHALLPTYTEPKEDSK